MRRAVIGLVVMVRETFRAALDGAQLDELDSRIYIEDISENIKLAVETMKRARNGQWLVSAPDHDELEVKITLMIKARQPEERMDVIEKIMGWATSGLTTTLSLKVSPASLVAVRVKVTVLFSRSCWPGV